MMIVYEIVWIYDAKMYVYGFTKLNAATRLCMYVWRVYVMFTNLSTQTSQRDYVCMYNECIFMFMRLPIQTSQRENVCMYVRKYDYDFSRIKCHNAFYYEIHEFVYGKWCMFNVFDVTVKIAIATICMASTHWDLAHYYVFNEAR